MNKIFIIILIVFVLMNISPIIKYLNKILKKLPKGVKYLIPIILLIIFMNKKTESFSQEKLSTYDTILKSIGYDHDTYYGVTSEPREHKHYIDPKYNHKHNGLNKNTYGSVTHTHSLEKQDVHTPLHSLHASNARRPVNEGPTHPSERARLRNSEVVTPSPDSS
tara:strand:+ start:1358 stop:1849 length:492 start_codon:yes stop_codon:yes gene_type:complete